MIYFILTIALTYLLYYIFTIRKYDEHGNLKKKKKKNDDIESSNKNEKVINGEKVKYPVEVDILIIKYRLDFTKMNFRALLKLVGLVCSIDVAIIITILSFLPTDNYFILMGAGFVLIFPVILISYALLGKFFKKKGMIINDKGNKKSQRNRK